MPLLRRAISLTLSALMAFGNPAEVLAASYVFRQASTAGTFPIPVITNNVVTAQTYYKVDGRSYSISWQGTGGRSPYQIEAVGTPLPPGCSVPSQTGSILTTSCTFTTEGSYAGVMAQLTDANGMVVRDNAPTIYVTSPAPTLGTYNFPFGGSVGIPYAGSLRISGGRQPFNVSRATGDLPPGLTLAAVQDPVTGIWTAQLSGTPTGIGSYTFDILVVDANQKQATSSKINVSVGYGPVSLTLRPSTTPSVFKGVAGKPLANAGVAIVGGQPPVSLTQLAGVLPPGMSLDQDGKVVGITTRVGTYPGIQIRALDSASNPRSATSPTFSIEVATELTALVLGASDAYQRNSPISTISTSVSGGTAPYAYALNGTLPPGLSFSSTTGRISGTPTVAGRYEGLSVVATDANGYAVETAPFAMSVADPLTVSGTPPKGVAATSYSFAFSAGGGLAPYAFTLVQGSLPVGLVLSPSGTISGTPFVAGSSGDLVVRVTDANGTARNTAPFSISIAEQLAVASGPSRFATTGTAYASAFTAAGGTAPYSFALVAGSLPPGLALATSGAVTGTPTSVGSYGPFSVRVVDAEGRIATADATIVVSTPLQIAGTAQGGAVGSDYAAAFSASGGTGPYVFDVETGALPDGLSIDGSSGRISGQPTKAGTFPGITVRATDAAGRTARTTASIVVSAPLRIAGSPSQVATVGQSYSASFMAAGGTAPYAFAISAGALPAGLTLSPGTGAISGMPTGAGDAQGLAIQVTDAAGRKATSDIFRIVVTDVLAVTGSASTSAVAGQAYAAQFSATGGSAPYAWSLASGTLPPGLSLDAAGGIVAGTPTTLGSYPGIQVRATDSAGRTALSAIFGISVATSLAIAGTPSISATVGQPYSAQFTATGGVGKKSFSLATGQLPTGLIFDGATGLIAGTPTAKGFSPAIAVRVRDETGSAATAQAFDLYVSDPLVVGGVPSPDAIVGAAYSGNATVAGGRSAYAWTLDAGTLPPGLQLSAVTGVIAGTPTAPGTASDLRLRVTDVDGRTGTTAPFSIVVAAPLALAGQAGPGTVGSAYSAQFSASGGQVPYAYRIVGAALPEGLVLDAATGRISGTPTTAATGGAMQVRVLDARNRTVSTASFQIDVRDPFRLVASNIGPGTVGLTYSAAIVPAGGRGPYSLTVASGTLPPGLSLEPGTGVIAGSPTQAGSYAGIVVAGVDADGRIARSETFDIDVALGIAVAGVPPQIATVGVPYGFSFSASGGQAPYGWNLAGGNLPAGLAFDGGSGAIGGTPTTAGTVSGLTAVATDRARRSASSRSFTVDVRDPVSVAGAASNFAGIGQPYAAAFTVAGGRGPYVFAMVGILPPGLSLSPTSGAISGTPTTGGEAVDLRVRATDADGRVGLSAPFAIATATPLGVSGSPQAFGDVGTTYDAAFAATGGKGPYAFSLAAGVLPAGLTLDAAAGRIAGTPLVAGTSAGLQVAVVDANGSRGLSQTFSIAIADPMSAVAQTPRGTVGATYAGRIQVSGGRGAFAHVLAAGTLPAGLSLDTATGRIAGTPSAVGTRDGLQVRVSDADGRSSLTPSFRIDVDGPLVVASTPSQSATVGADYDSTATATGGRQPYVFALASGSLPVGLVLDPSSGRIQGRPTAIGAAEGLVVSVVDADGRTAASRSFRIDVGAPMTVAASPSSAGTVGQTYGPHSFVASGGRGPYTYAVAGQLPAGLSLTSSGSLSGVPAAAGSFTGIQVVATDAEGRTATSASFGIQISSAVSVLVSMSLSGTIGTAFSGYVSAYGGRPEYRFDVAAGSLPPGLSLDASTGDIGGSPSAAGTYGGIRFRATDADGRATLSAAFQVVVGAPLAISYQPVAATRGTAYAIYPAVSGGRAPYRFGQSSGNFPSGLGLNATSGTISGTPTATGTSTVRILLSDADGRSIVSDPVTIDVAAALGLSMPSSYPVETGIATTVSGTLSGGVGPFTWSASGTVPGMTFNPATGAFEGSPTTGGSFPVSIVVRDAGGRQATASTTVTATAPFVVKPPAVLYVDWNAPYTGTFAASGGTPGYTFALTSGALPYGLTLNSTTGVVSGTATQKGSSFVTITVTDKSKLTLKVTANFIVNDGLQITQDRPQDPDPIDGTWHNGLPYYAYAGGFYGGQMMIRNGMGGPYAVTVTPDLPKEIGVKVVDDQIFVTGTPSTTKETTCYTMTATDASGRSGKTAWCMTIAPLPPIGWQPVTSSWPNKYAWLKVVGVTLGMRDWAMSKDGQIAAYSNAGSTLGDGTVSIWGDTGQWVETDNNGFRKLQVVRGPIDAPGFGKKIALSRGGDWMVVSAPSAAKNPVLDANGRQTGSIYVYRRDGNDWNVVSQSSSTGFPGNTSLAISDDGSRIAYDFTEYWTPKGAKYQSARSRIAVRVWNGSQFVVENPSLCSTAAEDCTLSAVEMKFSPDGKTLGVAGNGVAYVYKLDGGVWKNVYVTPAEPDGLTVWRSASSIALNTDGTRMLVGTSATMNKRYASAVYAYAWDGRFWNKVNFLQEFTRDSYGPGSYSPLISASDDLSTFIKSVPVEGYPKIYSWDGKTFGAPITINEPIGYHVTMSGDGGTFFSAMSTIWKRSWPAHP